MDRLNLLNQQELSAYLGVSPQTLVKWGKLGMPAFYRHSIFVLYCPDQVKEWLKQHETRPSLWRVNSTRSGKNKARQNGSVRK